ncbi:hypothetical protein O9H85_14225 [Paenibacillus filicis]|uniref:Uncharacterized protein n=1 Tax=Paenibacillus gyeongsangnamensis TaxID=3388067 RepID=A0ABT4Q9R7_9BACL|nr:hypothetical protein [Paenibacillus filicis]MCZ8513569.1 hypothetical protein [Paenibacillus filicis]
MLEQLALGGIRERMFHLLVKLAEQFGIKEEGDLYKIDLPNSVNADHAAVSAYFTNL